VGVGGLASTLVVRGGRLAGTRIVPVVSGGDTIHAGDGAQALLGSRVELLDAVVLESNERAAFLLDGAESSGVVASTVALSAGMYGVVVQQGARDPVDEFDDPIPGVSRDPGLDVATAGFPEADPESALGP
jgi:hypothetical protein